MLGYAMLCHDKPCLIWLIVYTCAPHPVLTWAQPTCKDAHSDAAGSVVTQMPYIDAVIKECLRLHDPATLLFRRALQDIPIGDNLVIPKAS